MKKQTALVKEVLVETFGLSDEQHKMVAQMAKSDTYELGNYTLEECDKEMVNVWISEAYANGENDYAQFLSNALAADEDIYTLTDNLGTWSQPIGEVVIRHLEYEKDYSCYWK